MAASILKKLHFEEQISFERNIKLYSSPGQCGSQLVGVLSPKP